MRVPGEWCAIYRARRVVWLFNGVIKALSMVAWYQSTSCTLANQHYHFQPGQRFELPLPTMDTLRRYQSRSALSRPHCEHCRVHRHRHRNRRVRASVPALCPRTRLRHGSSHQLKCEHERTVLS